MLGLKIAMTCILLGGLLIPGRGCGGLLFVLFIMGFGLMALWTT